MQLTITWRTLRKAFALLVGIVLVAGAVILLSSSWGDPLPDKLVDSKYEAVTLNSGQVLFGDLQPAHNGYLELRKAHSITQQSSDKDGDAPSSQVVPVTSEAIQPTSSVFLAAGEIAFLQPLRNKSIVAKIINGAK